MTCHVYHRQFILTEAVEVEHNHKTIAAIDIIKVPYGSMIVDMQLTINMQLIV